MARRKKKTRRKRRVPTNSNTQRVQTTVNINTMSEPKKKKKRRRRKPKTVQPDIFTLARYIPAKRHYFEPNQRFNNMAGKPTIDQRIQGQYNNLEKKMEQLSALYRANPPGGIDAFTAGASFGRSFNASPTVASSPASTGNRPPSVNNTGARPRRLSLSRTRQIARRKSMSDSAIRRARDLPAIDVSGVQTRDSPVIDTTSGPKVYATIAALDNAVTSEDEMDEADFQEALDNNIEEMGLIEGGSSPPGPPAGTPPKGAMRPSKPPQKSPEQQQFDNDRERRQNLANLTAGSPVNLSSGVGRKKQTPKQDKQATRNKYGPSGVGTKKNRFGKTKSSGYGQPRPKRTQKQPERLGTYKPYGP